MKKDSLKYSMNNQNNSSYFTTYHSNNNITIHSNNIERKFKSKIDSLPKMYSIQENIDYENDMNLSKVLPNLHYKQTKYLLTSNKYKKHKSLYNTTDYTTTYKSNWHNNEDNKNELIIKRYNKLSLYNTLPTTYYHHHHHHQHSSSSITNNLNTFHTFYKRSDYGRFNKYNKNYDTSLGNVPMNVNFNTLNSLSTTSNRYHLLNYEQIQQLDKLMHSLIYLVPNPNNSLFINQFLCSYCLITKKQIDYVKKFNQLNTKFSNNIDLMKSLSIMNSIKSYKNNHYNNQSITSPLTITSQQLPIISIQLKKFISIIRDRLIEESIPVKEIRLNGEVASSIIGSQNHQPFCQLDLIFRVDLSNSTVCAKIKSVVYSCIANMLMNTMKLDNNCMNCLQCTLPSNIPPKNMKSSPMPTPPPPQPPPTATSSIPQISSSFCCYPCSYCTMNAFNASIGLNKENLSSSIQTNTIQCVNKHEMGISSSEFQENRQPLHENQLNIVNQSNSQILQSTNDDIINDKTTCYTCQSYCNFHPICQHNSLLSPSSSTSSSSSSSSTSSSLSKCSICSRQFNCFNQYNSIHCKHNDRNQLNWMLHSQCNNDYIIKQYIQNIHQILKPTDAWNSYTLGYHYTTNNNNKLIENIINIKFIDRMHRQYEFTVDSFQIVLDRLLTFYDNLLIINNNDTNQLKSMNQHFYPIVVVESVATSYLDALNHLMKCIIVTKQPEEIYGGGLLNYCKLLVNNYKPSERLDIVSMEKYMCSRFFIDFPDIISQYNQLNQFLWIHFKQNQLKLKEDYLNILYEVVSHSTICLMTHERQQTLCLIQMFLRDVTNQQKQDKQSVVHILQEFSTNNWALDKVFYGTNYFPKQMYSINEHIDQSSQCQTQFQMMNIEQVNRKQTLSKFNYEQIQLHKVNEEENDDDDDDDDDDDAEINVSHDVENDVHDDGDVDRDDDDVIDPTKLHHSQLIDELHNEEDRHNSNKSIDNDNNNLQKTVQETLPQPPSELTYSNYTILARDGCSSCSDHHNLLNHPQLLHCHCHHHGHHAHRIHNEMYHMPQLVTYFPANDYIISSFSDKIQPFYSISHDTNTTYDEITASTATTTATTATTSTANTNTTNVTNSSSKQLETNILSNKLLHYHAKITLPQNTNLETVNHGDVRYYVGVPCSYSKYPTNTSNTTTQVSTTTSTTITTTSTTTTTTSNNNDNSNNSSIMQKRDDVFAYYKPFIYANTPNHTCYTYPPLSIQDNPPVLYHYVM
ncbi:hypothetical protein MN116_007540 [Schistosoma mekongi]|uniref:polynucleotide adenylyltransferase n=1 Tax=Schistosoma mekongi TaxID=38744 RepID=A0AAE2D278_SCHME|nr:hypothetical protein MN116_007540 [Schistosoma mekongi]